MNGIHRQNQTDAGLLFIRGILAVVFVYHGGQKLFGLFGGPGLTATAGWMESIGIPAPSVSALLAGGSEFFGGIALLLGVAARLVAIPMAFNMLVAILAVHRQAFDARAGGMEYPLTLGVLLVSVALLGPGRFTVSSLLWRSSSSSAVRGDGPDSAMA